MLTAEAIKTKARELGFDACGIAPADDHPELSYFPHWLARGYGGTMEYLTRSAEKRADVRQVLPSARTVIVTATSYNTDRPYSTEVDDPERAHISRYAWGDDYHDVIGGRLELLLQWMRETHDAPFEARAYVDTGPVQERVYAQYGGLGWIGKNTCLIHPELGSWLFLAEIITSLPLDADAPSYDQCGSCSLCLRACPTGAILEPGVLDATRCISYLTIEHRGEVPQEFAPAIGTHVYGCDICQDVCPWNQQAPVSSDRAWQPRPAWDQTTVGALEQMTDEAWTMATRKSPMKRAKRAGLTRNVAIARANLDRSGAGE
jgi:epoxyqueuosine reductase